MARSSLVALACTACLVTACDGQFVNLGMSDALLGGAGSAGAPLVDAWDVASAPLLEQEENLLLASPSLTSAGELFFSKQGRGSTGTGEPKPTTVWHALPASGGFGEPQPVLLGDLDEVDVASPAVSWSGDELWLGMNVDGNTDVFRSRLRDGAWTSPELVAELSSGFDDAPRPPELGGLLMALSSKRHGGGGFQYQVYLSERASPELPWSEPSQALVEAVNSGSFQSADGFLAEGGLALYFSSTRSGNSDLYVSRRASLKEPFGAPQALDDFNTAAEERMPWLSPEGARLYFVSNRPTLRYQQYALYVAERL